AGTRLGEAHWAPQVAAGSDLDQGDAGVLLMIGTQPAIVRAALLDLRAVGVRLPGGLAEFVPVVIGDVRADKVLDQAVLRTLLAEVDPTISCDDLRIDDAPAMRAEAAGRAEEGVIAKVHCCYRC